MQAAAFCLKYPGVRGILTLGRLLIWLAVFLFFYSSILVLFQFGSKSYVPKMIDGWGSIAQEFEKSYRTLSAAATAAPSGEAPAPATGQAPASTAAGSAQNPAEIPSYVPLLIWGSVVICLLGFFWIVAIAFQEGMLWGLGVLFIPGLFLIYWLVHLREATPPFVLLLIGVFVQFFVFTHYGLDIQEYFMGSPTPPPPLPPNPLAGMIMPFLLVLFS